MVLLMQDSCFGWERAILRVGAKLSKLAATSRVERRCGGVPLLSMSPAWFVPLMDNYRSPHCASCSSAVGR
jgi:hypothetical protein